MKQSNHEQTEITQQNKNKSQNDNFSNSSHCDYEHAEPLPESSRPRRDGPGGEDVQ